MNLTQLTDEWRHCKRCPLGYSANRHVLWELPDGHTDILFIGEGPGEGEDQLGKPFVGKAGKLLRGVLSEIDTEGLGIGFTNLLACRPFDDAGNRAPQPEEVSACSPRLSELIRLTKPMVIVGLGRIPDSYLTKEFLDASGFSGLYFSYYHPSYIVRQRGADYSTARQAYKDQLAFYVRKARDERLERLPARNGERGENYG